MNKVKLGIIIAVGILVLVGLFSYFYQEDKNIILEKEPNLTADERQIYEDRLAEAEAKLKQAETNEEKYNLYLLIGFQKYGLGRFAEAKAAYRNAEKYNEKKDYSVYTALYQVQLDMQDNEGARDSIKKAIEYGSGVADNWLKYIILEKERFNASNETLNGIYIEALGATAGQSDFDVMANYAQFLESTGNLQGAKEYWQKAAEANPGNKAVYDAEIKRLDALIQQQNAQ